MEKNKGWMPGDRFTHQDGTVYECVDGNGDICWKEVNKEELEKNWDGFFLRVAKERFPGKDTQLMSGVLEHCWSEWGSPGDNDTTGVEGIWTLPSEREVEKLVEMAGNAVDEEGQVTFG